MIQWLKHKMNFTGVDRLADKQEDFQEREEVFQLIKDNIDQIDPEKFNTRTFKEALEKKRSVDSGNQMVQDDPVMGQVLFGDIEDWREEVEKFLNKGETSSKLEKALEYFELM